MGRFNDEWLIDRTLFDYVSGGSCACCSFNFMPGGTAGLIQTMSELETDQQNAEIQALDKLPWPPEMRDQVWMERVRLRQKLKKEMKSYGSFWEEHGDAYTDWINEQARSSPDRVWKWFQLGRTQVTDFLKDEYNIHAAFGAVLCAVVEQVAHFELTRYPPDGRGEMETAFEDRLCFTRMGGFGIKDLVRSDGSVSTEAMDVWMQRHRSLAGPKLLDRAAKASDHGDEGDADDDTGTVQPGASRSEAGPSFRSDRRIIRLVIARMWADHLQKTFLKERPVQAEAETDE